MMARSTIDMWVGLLVLAAVVSLFFLAVQVSQVGSSHLQHSYLLRARFDNIGQLKVTAAVKSAGVLVGRVRDISLNSKQYTADVTLEMDGRYHFPVDSSLSVLTAGLLGEQYLSIDPGLDTNVLQAGQSIERTQPAVVLEHLISQFLFHKAQEGEPGKTS